MDALEYISSGSGDSNEFSSFFPSLEEISLMIALISRGGGGGGILLWRSIVIVIILLI
jgi:hypothetical protein